MVWPIPTVVQSSHSIPATRQNHPLARAVAGTENRAEMIDVLASVDEYVDRVLEES